MCSSNGLDYVPHFGSPRTVPLLRGLPDRIRGRQVNQPSRGPMSQGFAATTHREEDISTRDFQCSDHASTGRSSPGMNTFSYDGCPPHGPRSLPGVSTRRNERHARLFLDDAHAQGPPPTDRLPAQDIDSFFFYPEEPSDSEYTFTPFGPTNPAAVDPPRWDVITTWYLNPPAGPHTSPESCFERIR